MKNERALRETRASRGHDLVHLESFAGPLRLLTSYKVEVPQVRRPDIEE